MVAIKAVQLQPLRLYLHVLSLDLYTVHVEMYAGMYINLIVRELRMFMDSIRTYRKRVSRSPSCSNNINSQIRRSNQCANICYTIAI